MPLISATGKFDAAESDPYEDVHYIQHFRLALCAIKQKQPLRASYRSGKGGRSTLEFVPEEMLYSAKDDKFRVVGTKISAMQPQIITLNMARIDELCHSPRRLPKDASPKEIPEKRSVKIAIYGQRNALERCMIQFASYDKQTIYDEGKGCYLCDIFYDAMEETELLIRILSFGQVVQVLEPQAMIAQMRERVAQQMKWLEA